MRCHDGIQAILSGAGNIEVRHTTELQIQELISKAPFRFISRDQAILLQRELAPQVIGCDDPFFKARLLCGMDVAYDNEQAFVTAVVWDLGHDQVAERVNCIDQTSVPYIPGLLGFREGPLLLKVVEKLHSTPDVFMVDGQGVAHPRRCGLACQFGLATGEPTIGIAKSLLYGRPDEGMIVDSERHDIGKIISTSRGKQFFVSVGHRISLGTASQVVENCLRDGHPAPLRQAHLDSVELKGRVNP